MPDPLRLALGTFTVLPVPPPRRVTPATARDALLLAPAVGLLLALGAAAVAAGWQWVAGWLGPAGGVGGQAVDLVAAALAVAVLAWCTRGLHLDGLADTADGLGSGRRGGDGVAVMRRSDVGPFGVVTLVLVLLLQVAALAACLDAGHGTAALVVAVATGRAALWWTCRRGVPAATADGLGAAVAGTVPRTAAAGGSLLLAVLAAAWVGWGGVAGSGRGAAAAGVAAAGVAGVAVVAGLLAAALLTGRAVRRFGGITGDVCGAAVEVATTTTLLVLALA